MNAWDCRPRRSGRYAEGGCSNGSVMFDRSRRVSTSTSGPSSITTAAGRSRGTRMGLGSAAMAACTAAILSVSEFTHCRPVDAATCCSSSTGSVNVPTIGISFATGAAADAIAATGATGVFGATATVASATGAATVTGATGAHATSAGAGATTGGATAGEGAAATGSGATSMATTGAAIGAAATGAATWAVTAGAASATALK